ncbi:hypothetical protein [Budvicia diplopodorum]|uniref:hypothetical protein n=1 Tax=Budvicia diplopodorum TaxID=1119056 RepID=UPI00135A2519|nr:hypothetical protein [Budvicia diplopodorum]
MYRRITALLSALLLSCAVLSASAATADKTTPNGPWPHNYTIDGTSLTFYQPQLDSLEGNILKGRLAVSVKQGAAATGKSKAKDKLAYGVVWFSARTSIDTVGRTAQLDNITIDKVSFPTEAASQDAYLALIRKALPAHSLVTNLDQLEAALAIKQAEGIQTGISVDNKPPQILFTFSPALLVLVDGEPVIKPTEVKGVSRVINTRSLLLVEDNSWYLNFAGHWMKAPGLNGPWAGVKTVSPELNQARESAIKAKAVDVMDKPSDEMKKMLADGRYPTIYSSTGAAELITVQGEPEFAPIENTGLAYITNTTSDVFIDASADNAWYVLLSGRWFTASSTKGPWAYVPGDKLPADFAKIPPVHEKSPVLASIPGTPEARESLIANAIPQTASVNISHAKLQVAYDGGAAKFAPIDGTSMSYAVNTPLPVIQLSPVLYFAVQNGVWFTATAPNGPWSVALSVPSIIYTIPASSPVHYVTYVHVYSHTDTVVYVGYTPGYYGTVVTNGVVVYGTGYAYTPWVGTVWYGYPATYGYNAAFGYDPYVGWTFGFIAGAAWASAWYGPYWGPWYDHDDWDDHHSWYGGPSVAVSNAYGRWGNTVAQGTRVSWSNSWTGNYGTSMRGNFYNQATGTHGFGYAARNTNDYTGVTRGAAGDVRYNPETGRAVAERGGAAVNRNNGNAVAGGSRTTVNTRTGRVTNSVHAAGRTDQGATAAGSFNSRGAGGDVHGSGYVHYDASTGQVTHGGVVNTNGGVYAGKDGQIYRYQRGQGWQQAQPDGQFKSVRPSADSGVTTDRLARSRGDERTAQRSHPAADSNQAQQLISRTGQNHQQFQQNHPNVQQNRQSGQRLGQNGAGQRIQSNGDRFQGQQNVNRGNVNRGNFDRGNYSHGFQGHVGGVRRFR